MHKGGIKAGKDAPVVPSIREDAPYPAGWTQEPPREGGEYWHWSGCQSSAPLPTFVMFSGCTGKCFVSIGQLGITQAVDCDEYGGWWFKMTTPPIPKTKQCYCSACD